MQCISSKCSTYPWLDHWRQHSNKRWTYEYICIFRQTSRSVKRPKPCAISWWIPFSTRYPRVPLPQISKRDTQLLESIDRIPNTSGVAISRRTSASNRSMGFSNGIPDLSRISAKYRPGAWIAYWNCNQMLVYSAYQKICVEGTGCSSVPENCPIVRSKISRSKGSFRSLHRFLRRKYPFTW